MNEAKTKTCILNAALELIHQREAPFLTFEKIASKANIAETEIRQHYSSIDELTNKLSLRSIGDLKTKAKALVKRKGIEVLKELLSNDIILFYGLEVDKLSLTEDSQKNHKSALQNFANYFNVDMPEIYFEFFENNKNLLPTEDIDTEFFAHFISHSLQFFNYKTLSKFESTSEGRKMATEQILGSVFGFSNMELNKF